MACCLACGGDRDQTKPVMRHVALTLCDDDLLTSDNSKELKMSVNLNDTFEGGKRYIFHIDREYTIPFMSY